MMLFIIAALAAILSVTASPYAAINTAVFDLPVIVLVFFSLKKGFLTGLVFGIFFGITTGVLGTEDLALDIFLYGAAGCTIGYIGKWFYKEKLTTFLLLVFLSTLFIYFSKYAYNAILVQMRLSVFDYTLRIFIPSAIYTAAAAVFLFYFFKELKF